MGALEDLRPPRVVPLEPTVERGKRPIMLAIAGDSAAGKTTITQGIAAILGRHRVTTVCTDDYHRFDRRQRAALEITPLRPECNYVDIIEQHLELLASGQSILKPVYAHTTGSFDPPRYVEPSAFVVVEGLLPLLTDRMRRCFDATVYLDPPEDLRRRWKVQRDCTKRGYRPEQVLAELERREPDSAAFIRPQRNHADMVVRFRAPEAPGRDDEHLDAAVVLRPSHRHPDLRSIADGVEPTPIRLRLARDGGRPVDVLEIDGNVSARDAQRLEDDLWERMDERTEVVRRPIGTFTDGAASHHSHALALTQLLIVSSLVGVPVGG